MDKIKYPQPIDSGTFAKNNPKSVPSTNKSVVPIITEPLAISVMREKSYSGSKLDPRLVEIFMELIGASVGDLGT